MIRIVLLVALVLTTVFFLISYLRGEQSNNNPRQIPVTKKMNTNQKVISWIPYWDQQNAFTSFQNNVDAFDYISLFWYRLDSDGNITTYEHTVEDESIVDFAKQNNVKVFALIANLPDYTEGENASWDYRRVDRVISSQERREKHITQLVALVKEKNFDGLDIDYEALRKNQREDFSIFIEDLAEALHKENKLLGVAIHPKTAEYLPSEDNGSHAQDLSRLADAADHLYFMTYLEHGTYSDPGSIGSINWITEILEYAIFDVQVPSEKIFLGIGIFGIEWRKNSNNSYTATEEYLTYADILERTEKIPEEILIDNNSKSIEITYEINGMSYVIWFENAQSVNEKKKLAQNYGLGGLAFWRLSNEDQGIWDIVRSE